MNAPCCPPPCPPMTCPPATGVQVIIKTFTASGPYMPSPGLVTAVVECIGGGGASGALSTIDSAHSGGSGGGGSGGYSRIALAATLVAGGVNVTIGAGGVAGSSAGGAGGATTFGALCIANGGGGGGGNNLVDQDGEAGTGAPPGVGDFVMPGNDGGKGDTYFGVSTNAAFTLEAGYGGQLWGGGQHGLKAGPGGAGPGTPGPANTGAGASGALSHAATVGVGEFGSPGGSGICNVTEYCWADVVPGEDCFPTGAARVAWTPHGHGYGGFDD